MSMAELEELLSAHMLVIKKFLFARSLRLLPLSEQVGVFDALAFLIQEIPSLVPLSDQHLLAFLSEFLKMASIGDGDMKDSNMSGYVVDKNGFVTSAQDRESQATKQLSMHTSAVFLRRECAAKSPIEGSYVIIPEELPFGVQLRVSGLRLFRAVIRQHVDEFFEADSATPVGTHFAHSLLNLATLPFSVCAHSAFFSYVRKHPAPCDKSIVQVSHFASSNSRCCRALDTPRCTGTKHVFLCRR